MFGKKIENTDSVSKSLLSKKVFLLNEFIKLKLSASINFDTLEAKFSILSILLKVTLTGIFLNLSELIISLLEKPFLISYLPAFMLKTYLVLYAASKNVVESFKNGIICCCKLFNPVPDLMKIKIDSSLKFVLSE